MLGNVQLSFRAVSPSGGEGVASQREGECPGYLVIGARYSVSMSFWPYYCSLSRGTRSTKPGSLAWEIDISCAGRGGAMAALTNNLGDIHE